MADDERLPLGKRIFYGFLENTVSLLGGILVFVCLYWFFHFETWHERFIYIGMSILFVYVLVKILPDRPE
ncbi:hypothetical protein ACGVWS_15020 [Enterobacteriaceae bacterium LUAb1]